MTRKAKPFEAYLFICRLCFLKSQSESLFNPFQLSKEHNNLLDELAVFWRLGPTFKHISIFYCTIIKCTAVTDLMHMFPLFEEINAISAKNYPLQNSERDLLRKSFKSLQQFLN